MFPSWGSCMLGALPVQPMGSLLSWWAGLCTAALRLCSGYRIALIMAGGDARVAVVWLIFQIWLSHSSTSPDVYFHCMFTWRDRNVLSRVVAVKGWWIGCVCILCVLRVLMVVYHWFCFIFVLFYFLICSCLLFLLCKTLCVDFIMQSSLQIRFNRLNKCFVLLSSSTLPHS